MSPNSRISTGIIIFIIQIIIGYAQGSGDSVSSIGKGQPVGKFIFKPEMGYKNGGEFPYVASLEYHGYHTCGAVIIRNDAILTAAHCFIDNKASHFGIRAGTFKIGKSNDPSVQTSVLKEFIIHPKYNKTTKDYDVAIGWLKIELNLTKFVHAVKLPNASITSDSFHGENGVALGWGRTDFSTESDILIRANLKVMKRSKCSVENKKLATTVFCAIRGNRASSVCSGDSGGPFVLRRHQKEPSKHLLMGIIRGAHIYREECIPEMSSYFTDVALLRPWIDEQLEK